MCWAWGCCLSDQSALRAAPDGPRASVHTLLGRPAPAGLLAAWGSSVLAPVSAFFHVSVKGACVPVRLLWFDVAQLSELSAAGPGEARSWAVPREGSREDRGAEGGSWPVGAYPHPLCAPQHLQLVRQEMAVCPEQLSEFVDSLRQYLRGTAGAGSCFQ